MAYSGGEIDSISASDTRACIICLDDGGLVEVRNKIWIWNLCERLYGRRIGFTVANGFLHTNTYKYLIYVAYVAAFFILWPVWLSTNEHFWDKILIVHSDIYWFQWKFGENPRNHCFSRSDDLYVCEMRNPACSCMHLLWKTIVSAETFATDR